MIGESGLQHYATMKIEKSRGRKKCVAPDVNAYLSYIETLREDWRDSFIDDKPCLRDSLLEGYVLWFRNSTAPEELATRLVADLPKDHCEIVMDAYKTAKRERRCDETAFELTDAPLSPGEIAERALQVKKYARQMRREAIGNSARKALAVPGPFERSRRDILMNR